MAINNKIRVTNFIAVNSGNFTTRQSQTLTTSWTAARGPYGINTGGGIYLALGYNNSSAVTAISRSTNFDTWNTVTIPAMFLASSQGTRQIAYGNGIWVITNGDPGNTNHGTRACISTDTGLTWAYSGALPVTHYWNETKYATGNTFMSVNSAGGIAVTTNANSGGSATWAAGAGLSISFAQLTYGNGRWLALANDGISFQYSDNNGSSWSSVLSTGTAALNFIEFISGKFYGFSNGVIYMSSSGIAWSAIAGISGSITSQSFSKVGDRYIISVGQAIKTSTDLVTWKTVNELTGDTAVVNTSTDTLNSYYLVHGDCGNIDYLPVYIPNATSGFYYSRGVLTINDGNSSYIDITAAKGNLSRTIRVPVLKGQYTSDINSIQVYPGILQLASTLDGVVNQSAYATAISTIFLYTNGIDDTNNWTITKTDGTSVTSTLSGANITVTSLGTSVDSANITISAINNTTGKALNFILTVRKNKDSTVSGISIASSYSGFSTAQTAIYIKFLTTGYFQIKQGSGGTYTNAGIWYNPPNTVTPQGGNYYMIVDYTSTTSDTLTAGTNGVIGGSTWNQMNVDREYYLSNAASGSHIVNLSVKLATSNTGANAAIGSGTLELKVP